MFCLQFVYLHWELTVLYSREIKKYYRVKYCCLTNLATTLKVMVSIKHHLQYTCHIIDNDCNV